MAVDEHGSNEVHNHVGVEPSGKSFNAIHLNPNGLPHNPFIDSGAIMIASLVERKLEEQKRFEKV